MRAHEEEREVNRTARRGVEATEGRKMKLSFSLHLPGKKNLELRRAKSRQRRLARGSTKKCAGRAELEPPLLAHHHLEAEQMGSESRIAHTC